ncbi:hypothetical protein MIR68_003442 [Amoeboaphelidium protococcarum]|nr:hypothetical protein MIR68_003442 [Amoeboaphelidium protococcarum]
MLLTQFDNNEFMPAYSCFPTALGTQKAHRKLTAFCLRLRNRIIVEVWEIKAESGRSADRSNQQTKSRKDVGDKEGFWAFQVEGDGNRECIVLEPLHEVQATNELIMLAKKRTVDVDG